MATKTRKRKTKGPRTERALHAAYVRAFGALEDLAGEVEDRRYERDSGLLEAMHESLDEACEVASATFDRTMAKTRKTGRRR